jgi:hypothetical protein
MLKPNSELEAKVLFACCSAFLVAWKLPTASDGVRIGDVHVEERVLTSVPLMVCHAPSPAKNSAIVDNIYPQFIG